MISQIALLLSILAAELASAVCPLGHSTHASTKRAAPVAPLPPADDKKGVLFMNRIAPTTSTLYIANADGSGERQLLKDDIAGFDYHATFSTDGKWITFTSERIGDGQADIYKVRPDGSDIEQLVGTSYFEDASVLSPHGNLLAYVSTETNWTANIYVKNLHTNKITDLTHASMGSSTSPHGFFRPSWSPDGSWIAFSSDRNTAWIGNTEGTNWAHSQELSVYVARPDGSDFRKVVSKDGYSLGSPKWSPDGTRITFYEMTVDATHAAHGQDVENVVSQIASVDFLTGGDYRYHTTGPGCKISGQWLTHGVVGYSLKAGPNAGLNYTQINPSFYQPLKGDTIRNPSWSPDGKTVIYEKQVWEPVRPMNKPLYSWDKDWEYRFTDIFPTVSKEGVLAVTQAQLGNGSLISMDPGSKEEKLVFDAYSTGQVDPSLGDSRAAGALQPSWSSDSRWMVFGLGAYLPFRSTHGGWIYRINSDGTSPVQLTNETAGEVNSGFPSLSPDGTKVVYRDFGSVLGLGLRLLDLSDGAIVNLTNSWDNFPQWSPDGQRILFTRKSIDSPETWNFTDIYDVYTIRPDGTELRQLTISGANDAHPTWAPDGGILWTSGMYGFRDEAAIYDNSFQPYGKIMWMEADGSNMKVLTDSMWEDGAAVFVTKDQLFK